MYRRQPLKRAKSPRTWGEAYRELAEIDEIAQALLARWQGRIEEEVAEASCCITIAETLRAYRMRAWGRAVHAYERGKRIQSPPQLELFR